MPEQPVISIDDITLQSGKHEAGQGFCFMEAAAFIAGEDHSDHPACVCRVLGIFARRWNDYLKTKDRQKMKPYIRLVIGTAGDGFGERRSWMIIDWCVRDVLAVYCDARNLKDFARELKGLPEIRDWEAAKRVSDVLFALARDLARDLARALDLDLALALDLDLDLDLALALDLAFDLALALDLDLDLAFDLALAIAFDLALALDKIRDSGFALMDRMVMLEMRTMERTQQDTASTLVEK